MLWVQQQNIELGTQFQQLGQRHPRGFHWLVSEGALIGSGPSGPCLARAGVDSSPQNGSFPFEPFAVERLDLAHHI